MTMSKEDVMNNNNNNNNNPDNEDDLHESSSPPVFRRTSHDPDVQKFQRAKTLSEFLALLSLEEYLSDFEKNKVDLSLLTELYQSKKIQEVMTILSDMNIPLGYKHRITLALERRMQLDPMVSNLEKIRKLHKKESKGVVRAKNLVTKKKTSSNRLLQLTEFDIQSIMLDDIIMGEHIGEGNFGDVYEGSWHSTRVACKLLKTPDKRPTLEEFAKEAYLLKELRHPNILFFLGIYTQNDDFFLITEFMARGNLSNFLYEERTCLDIPDLVQISREICLGMRFLGTRNIIHRDLAARNVLVHVKSEQGYVIKIADFGLSRLVSDKYYISTSRRIPAKWTAIEGLQYDKYSHESDVWSFGVVLWEIFSFGKLPYPDIENSQVLGELLKGRRLEKPRDCPPNIYQLMRRCWDEEPHKRPSFGEISEELDELENSNSPHLSPSKNKNQVQGYVDNYGQNSKKGKKTEKIDTPPSSQKKNNKNQNQHKNNNTQGITNNNNNNHIKNTENDSNVNNTSSPKVARKGSLMNFFVKMLPEKKKQG